MNTYKHILTHQEVLALAEEYHVDTNSKSVKPIVMDYWMHEGHNSEDFLKMTKTYQAAADGDAKAKQIIQDFLDFEKS